MYKIVEVAEKLGKSKTAIYNKLNENQGLFKQHLKKIENVKVLDDDGIDILKDLFGLNEVETNVETGSSNPSSANDSSHIEKLISELESRIKYLEEENRKLLNNQSKQLENFQILLLNEQKKNKLLEDNIEEDQNQEKNAASHLHGLAKLMYYFKQNKKRQD
jgi:vacuolar-type H+-ATPase subunit I/STV1